MDFPVADLGERFLQTGIHGFAVVTEDGSLFGIVSVSDYRRALAGEFGSLEYLGVEEIATRDLITVYPDETVGEALKRMSPRDLSRLPVVARDDPLHLVGMIRRSDIVRSYDVALSRRAALRHKVQQFRLDALTPEGVNIVEIPVQPGSRCAGMQMKDIPWPEDSLIASLRHGRQVFIPHGKTLIKQGDVLIVVAEGSALEAVRSLTLKESA